MRKFTDEQLKEMTLEQAQVHLGDEVYLGSAFIEKLQVAGKVSGNGHHARQNLALHAQQELASRWNK